MEWYDDDADYSLSNQGKVETAKSKIYLDLPFFLEFGYFPISNFTKAPDQRTPATESDTNKER